MSYRRTLAVTAVLGSAVVAYAAVGNGDIEPTTDITVITVTSPTGSGSGTATLNNTTTATPYSVLIGSDATCDPEMTFALTGGNPSTIAGMASRDVQIGCPPRGTEAMRRCLLHATNNLNDTALADLMGLCVYGTTPGTLTPLQTSIDFGSVTVGQFAQRSLTIRNDAVDETITRVYLQTSDLDGNFQIAAPCNPDAGYCDEELAAAVAPGGSFTVNLECQPQATGVHSAQVLVGTNTFQLLSLGVTLQCTGTATTAPALGVNPTTIAIPSPVDVLGDTAGVVVHLENPGGATLVIADVRIVDVDNGAAEDWRYTASGKCSGQISTMCQLGPGDRADINLTFDPSAIGSRRAALLVSYRDTIDRTLEIPLDAVGLGATVTTSNGTGSLDFGSVPVGRMSQLPVELINNGNRDAMVMLSLTGATTPPFTLAPATSTTVVPALPRTVLLTCAPTTAGTFTTTLTAQPTDALTMAPVTITATCDGIAGELYATPTSLPLGEIPLGGGTVVRTVQLASTDVGMPLTFAGQPVLDVPNASITVGALTQATTPASFTVTITPQTTGTLAATISVMTTSGETLLIPLSATVVRASYIVAPTLDLGTFCVDQPTTSSNVALVSDGTGAIELLAPQLQQSPSPFALDFTTPPLYPHVLRSGLGVVVAITPKRRQTAAVVNDTLTWRSDVAGKLTAPTELTARFIDSGGAIAPPALNFGEATVHLFTDNGQRVVIQNCNPTPLMLDPPMIRTPFSIDSPNFPAMLNPSERFAFSVGFHPTRVGAVSDTLRITSPQLPGAPLEVVLTGSGGTGGMQMPDAGVGSANFESTRFYACACRTSRPVGIVPIVIALVCALRPRRRSSGRRAR